MFRRNKLLLKLTTMNLDRTQYRLLAATAVAFIFALPALAQLRTVYDTELGALFSDPNSFTYADLGARVGSAHDITQFSQMNPGALKVSQSRFHVLKPSDDT